MPSQIRSTSFVHIQTPSLLYKFFFPVSECFALENVCMPWLSHLAGPAVKFLSNVQRFSTKAQVHQDFVLGSILLFPLADFPS